MIPSVKVCIAHVGGSYVYTVTSYKKLFLMLIGINCNFEHKNKFVCA